MKPLSKHPYAVTSIIFLTIIIYGRLFLYWQKSDFEFLLIVYFIVTIGIRLDDIARRIGFSSDIMPEEPPVVNHQNSQDIMTLSARLDEIGESLTVINGTLRSILVKLPDASGNRFPEQPPPSRNFQDQ